MSYFIMNSGKKIYPASINESDICIEDIAHHLTKICRYGGALPLGIHYSVAQHSIELVKYAESRHLDKAIITNLLMHDSAEAYLGDIVSPLKALLSDYKVIENKVDHIIHKKYNLCATDDIKSVCKEFDQRILLDEIECFSPGHIDAFSCSGLERLGVDIQHMKLHVVKYEFMHYCYKYGIAHIKTVPQVNSNDRDLI